MNIFFWFKRMPFFVALIAVTAPMQAQDSTSLAYPGRPRYPEGLFAIGAGIGVTKYLGEFLDHHLGIQGQIGAEYAILPELSVGLQYAVGSFVYERRVRQRNPTLYVFQFGDTLSRGRSSSFDAFALTLKLNLFPRQYLNPYVVAGAGVMTYSPEDYRDFSAKIIPSKEKYFSFSVPVGVGVEYFVQRDLAVFSELVMNNIFVDDVDAYASGALRDKYFQRDDPIALDEGYDSYVHWNLGIKYFLFENDDLDGDLLPNELEESLHTNPYDPDTDGDRLTDYEEVKETKTNPLLIDSDGDALTDFTELKMHRTDPMNRDTDEDEVSDPDELSVYKTNPLDADTDHDRLRDGEEIQKGTNPNNADSDTDGLSDEAELRTHRTNPVNADSDGDLLNDQREIALKADPLRADTDGDGLSDGEEVLKLHTDPVKSDTDGDRLTDRDEIRERGTDPLRADTDSDGIPDAIDKCPTSPETYNGFQDEDGCPDVTAKSSASAETKMRIDTIVVREGATITLFGVNFEFDRAEIRPESIPILDENARLFKKYPELVVEIRGHTDSKGTAEYNEELSLRRAQSVKDYLVSVGVKSERLIPKGIGFAKPVATNDSEFGRARNRRIEFFVLKAGEKITKP